MEERGRQHEACRVGRAGRVELAGVDVTDRTASARARLGLGRSFQDSRLFSGLTVRDALAVSLERFTDVGDPFNAILRLPLLVAPLPGS